MESLLKQEFENEYSKVAADGKWLPDFRVNSSGEYIQPTTYWAHWGYVAGQAKAQETAPRKRYEINVKPPTESDKAERKSPVISLGVYPE